MTTISIPRVLISGVGPQVGKSLITLGLALELRRRGVSVSVCVANANITLGTLYKRITGRFARCLDARILSASQINTSIYYAALGADVVLIDGYQGLYDGFGAGTKAGSDSEIAAITRSPTLMVVDARGFGNSLAALFKGYQAFAQGFTLDGALLNRVPPVSADDDEVRDREFFEAVMQAARLPQLFGALPDAPFDLIPIPERPTQRRNLATVPRQFFVDLATFAADFIDIDAVLALARRAPSLDLTEEQPSPSTRRCRIAVADDACFGLCFQDNLDLLRYRGAELKSFSPIADSKLPSGTAGVYLPGAFLHEYGPELSANTALLDEILAFVDRGGVVYAEGAATAYLCRQFEIADRHRLAGVGAIDAVAHCRDDRFGYCEGASIEDTVIGAAGILVKGVSLSDWSIDLSAPVNRSMRISQQGGRPVPEGFLVGDNGIASFHFFHWGSHPFIPEAIIEAAQSFAATQSESAEG